MSSFLPHVVLLMGAYARALLSCRDEEALELLEQAGLSPKQAASMLAEDIERDTVAARRRRAKR